MFLIVFFKFLYTARLCLICEFFERLTAVSLSHCFQCKSGDQTVDVSGQIVGWHKKGQPEAFGPLTACNQGAEAEIERSKRRDLRAINRRVTQIFSWGSRLVEKQGLNLQHWWVPLESQKQAHPFHLIV